MKPFSWGVNEPDLHKYIISAYTSKGYECTNFHESGAAVENGVDILAQNDQEQIAFCIKIKPTKEDITQLNKFVNSHFKRKYYVYIEDPTRPFHDELLKHPEIEILNSICLDRLFKTEQVIEYLKSYFYSHEIFREFEKILVLCHSVKEGVPQKVNLSKLGIIWEWKDRAVSFNKIANTLYKLNDDHFKSVYEDKDGEIFLKLINDLENVMGYLRESLERLRIQMEELKKKYPGVLSYFWLVCKGRSNWFELLGPLSSLPSSQIPEQFFYFFFKHLPKEFPYTLLTRILEHIQEIGQSLEDGVDWTFEYIIKNG